MTLKPISEQVLVVTGASSGNGLAIAEMAAARGAAVLLVARNGGALVDIQAGIESRGGRAAICIADVAEDGAADRIVEAAIAAFGGFDSWVNNAALATYGTLEQIPLADHRRIFEVNYFAVLAGSLAAARHLRGKGGAIVNIGSILSDRAIIQQGPYSATKHAVKALTDTLRMELERESAGISVTLIKPGAIATLFSEHARNYMDAPPTLPPPLYDPDLVADAVLFACTHRKRDLIVGGGGLLSSVAARLAPRLTDIVMEAFATRAQQKPGDPGDPARRDNLYEPRADGHKRGSQDVSVRETSLSLQAQKYPASFGIGLAAAAVMLALGGKAVARVARDRRGPTAPPSR